ncbi:MAG: (E)-4-hydroxy-3-methylbut-2-enyl-diphosphate synthase, partial [Bacteroidales bacterium]|nr:(E)-4-hydroxy-3-methylbut-2-enyl-diphosphate synthase [Bacteroidales bacterium]
MSKDRLENIYCNNPFQPSRLKTREVFIGNVPMGSMHPVRIQSMTNTPTGDTIASVEQCIRIIEKGADYVRLTAANIQEAENLVNIKKELRTRGYSTPLIADVHFNPRVAETSARIVEKIRINPGNLVSSHDKGKPSIREKLVPLINICKEYGTAMRIGVNHGSLSKRILQEYGDTPTGMVESAMEYLEICREENFHQLIFSMKSSNTRVMVQAYRLLVSKMLQLGDVYPLHLGVTEAGDGEDGRIKSAAGIGTLMADGLGDTIRISLTEDPEEEIP